jgi:hypothetical protein
VRTVNFVNKMRGSRGHRACLRGAPTRAPHRLTNSIRYQPIADDTAFQLAPDDPHGNDHDHDGV